MDAPRLLWLAALAPALAVAAPPQTLRVLTPSPAQFEKIEIALSPARAPSNPFDPNEVELDAVIRTPSGKILSIPGFWFQDYRRSLANPEASGKERIEALAPTGDPEWRVRFATAEAGNHIVQVRLRERGKVTYTGDRTVNVRPGATRGWVRRSPRNPWYLEDGAGHTFFPLGENLCMYERKEGTYYYDRLLEKLGRAGANYVRLWQEYYVPNDLSKPAGAGDGGFTGFPLETTATGLGRYDLASAWRLDYVSELCERTGVYWQLASEMVVWWEPRLAYRWKRNPYNAENGGPCKRPVDYFTDDRARELVRRRLRYNVARWGWATHLAAWELWNEVDNMEGFDPDANAAWHREMGGYLKKIDPWQHLVTTSWRDPKMFAVPEIDIVQAHSYFGPEYDAAQYTLQDTEHLMRPYGKPFFFGEQGIDGPVSVDPEGKHFHDALWASSLSGAAGAGMYWWWHNYVEPYNLYGQYTPVSKFLAGVDLAAHKWKAPVLSRPNLPVSLNVYGLVAEDRALLWVHDPLAWRVPDGKTAVRGPSQTGATLNVVGLGAGSYEIEWWSTSTGEVVARGRADVRPLRHFGYGIDLKPPQFWGDIAARVIRTGQSWKEQ